LTVITAAVDDDGTTYVEDESATAVPFERLDVLEVLVLEDETVDAVSLFAPPQATTTVSSAQITALRRSV